MLGARFHGACRASFRTSSLLASCRADAPPASHASHPPAVFSCPTCSATGVRRMPRSCGVLAQIWRVSVVDNRTGSSFGQDAHAIAIAKTYTIAE